MLEANACGLPAVTVEHPDNAARHLIVEGGNGFVVALDAPASRPAIVKPCSMARAGMKPTPAPGDRSEWLDWHAVADQVAAVLLGARRDSRPADGDGPDPASRPPGAGMTPTAPMPPHDAHRASDTGRCWSRPVGTTGTGWTAASAICSTGTAWPPPFTSRPSRRARASADRLGDEGVRQLDQRFEIGGHTLTHPRLSTVTVGRRRARHHPGTRRARIDPRPSADQLLLPVGGDYRPAHIRAGQGGRLHHGPHGERYSRCTGGDPCGHPRRARLPPSGRRAVVARMAGYRPLAAAQLFWNWDRIAITMFDQALVSGGVYHLWGHSWEIDGTVTGTGSTGPRAHRPSRRRDLCDQWRTRGREEHVMAEATVLLERPADEPTGTDPRSCRRHRSARLRHRH